MDSTKTARLLRFIAVFTAAGLMLLGSVLKTVADWRDVYVLPTNGDAGTNIKIDLSVDKTDVQPGDGITLSFKADRDCWLTLMAMGTSGKILKLWPNNVSGTENFVQAGVSRQFPAQSDQFRYIIAAPDGTERIFAYATSEKGKILNEDEFKNLGKGAFKQFKGLAKDLATEFQTNANQLPDSVKWGSAQVNVTITTKSSFVRPAAQQSNSQSAATLPGVGTSAERPNGSSGQGSPTGIIPVSPSSSSPSSGLENSQARTFILSIGASTAGLKYCENDARNVAQIIKQKLGVREDNIKLLLGSNSTYQGVSEGLAWLASKTQPEDVVFIYFSGHGTSIPDQPPYDETDNRDEAFVLYHTEKMTNYKQALAKKIIMMDDEFNVRLKKIPARQKLVAVDACHSGTITKEASADSEGFVSKYYPLVDPDTGQTMWNLNSKSAPTNYGNDHETLFSACLDNQSSYEDQNNRSGLFTYYFVNAIKTGAGDLANAFEKAKSDTIKSSREAQIKSRGKVALQTPILTDPHGFSKSIKFPK